MNAEVHLVRSPDSMVRNSDLERSATPGPRDESHIQRIARRKLNAPEGWEVCGWQRVDPDGLIVEGGVPRLLKAGPRKGSKTWRDSAISKVVMTRAEMRSEHDSYEALTGRCGECLGSGKVVASWSVADGVKHRECKDCGGTGRAALAGGEQ